MADTKREQERDELHRAIWAIADELRGAVDGWDTTVILSSKSASNTRLYTDFFTFPDSISLIP